MTTQERIEAGHVHRMDEVSSEMIFMADVIMESHLGRKLNPRERVGFKNGDPLDNRDSNLVLVSTIATM